MKRLVPFLLTIAALMLLGAPLLVAQHGSGSGVPEDKITVVSAEGRSVLVSEDGGKTWRWVGGNEGEEAYGKEVESLRAAIQGSANLVPTASSPDPATGVVVIPLKTIPTGEVEFRLYDSRGTQTDIQQIEVSSLQPEISFNTASLPSGLYSFSLRCGGVVAGVGRIAVAR